ncbi:DNA-dependent helicase II [Deinococcus sp. SL84]|uniref:DNA-dependent helicase II n=1 Tax=Deinococcus sp. SL84 TaxID=2994663 RepID=UPI0022769076|nr:DNA-dependent helicase II [Deinococcus sp. SL84]MCY1703685.1 DNA-dependent helicase II [Deinococcus sp. SL84]
MPKKARNKGDEVQASADRSVTADRFVMNRAQGRFSETKQSGGVVIVNAKTGKAYRDNYEAFLQQTRKAATRK